MISLEDMTDAEVIEWGLSVNDQCVDTLISMLRLFGSSDNDIFDNKKVELLPQLIAVFIEERQALKEARDRMLAAGK